MVGRKKTRVRQLDYETSEPIEEYNSMEEAAYDNFITKRMISFAVLHNGGNIDKMKLKFEYIK